MRIKSVIAEIESRKRMYGIAEFKKCLQEIGNPQTQLKCIHVAGTNGKGSTSNYIASILKLKYKVGLFTSPYLLKHNDRIRINDQFIEDEKIIEYYDKYDALWQKYNLSSFEIDMFMAIMYFIEHNVDVCVFEVGLGGELDATNVIYSTVSTITNISFDHEAILGNTLFEIAKTKAGIIKENSCFVTADKIHFDLYQKICCEKNTKCLLVNNSVPYTKNTNIRFNYKNLEIELNTVADYQVKNSILALEVVKAYEPDFPNELIIAGLKNAFWRGRAEIVSEKPLVMVDGAHNLAGIEVLIQTLQSFKDVKIVFSALKDKSYKEMLGKLKLHFSDVYITKFDYPRAIGDEEISALGTEYIADVQQFIVENQNYQGLIVICGSLYFISDYLIRRR